MRQTASFSETEEVLGVNLFELQQHLLASSTDPSQTNSELAILREELIRLDTEAGPFYSNISIFLFPRKGINTPEYAVIFLRL